MKVVEVKTKRELLAFIRFPLSLYSGDEFYVPQLTRDMKVHFSAKNPFLRHAEVKFFLAKKGDATVGRIASIVDPQHVRLHNERAGFFGFFECVKDTAVSDALLGRVGDELKGRGMEIMRGPMSFSTNEECGFLLEGFGIHPMLMTPYNKPYYNDMMESCGMTKSKDLIAFIYDFKDSLPEKVLRVAALAEKKGIRVRPIDMKRFREDMRIFRDIYNAAWERNWGFLPLSEEELEYSAGRLKPLVVPEFTLIAEKDGEPVAFMGLIPDFNFVLKRMGGSLNPVTILKALFASKKIPGLRLLLHGVREEYRNRGVDALLFKKGFEGIMAKGGLAYKQIEFSWILEDNLPIIRIAELFGARRYKRYRIYEKGIA
ncbi:MAG TPA: hypothetical protein VF790_14500 [Dissulfurispiraceae bacterium]